MEVYSPSSDNLYESRSDFTLSVVNKRRNYENLQRSIQAHKNRLAMARMKKGKNLPSDDLSKYEGSGCCRQSTADTSDGFEQYRFRRHTQSSLNKIIKPVNKYNDMGATNSFDEKYDNEQMYIRKYDDFRTKVDQSLVRCHTRLQPKLSNKSDFSFDQDFGVNKVEISENELEKKVVEILGKLLLNKEFKQNMGVLSQKQQMQLDGTKVFQDENHDRMVDLLTKCISTTLNSAANESLDNLSSSRTAKSVNVEINLNMPSAKETEPVVTVNMQDDVVEESSVFIENVFDKDTKVVKDNIFKDFFGKFRRLYSTDKKDKHSSRRTGQAKMQLKNIKEDKNKFVDKFQVNKVGSVVGVGELQPTLINEQVPFKTQVQNVVHPQMKPVQKQVVDNEFKKIQTDLEEQKLWNMCGQTQISRKNSFVNCNFRPFSRSRSQSVHMQQKVGSVKPQVLQRNDSFFWNTGGKMVRRNSGVVPVQKNGFCGNFNVVHSQVQNGVHQQVKPVQKQVVDNEFKGEQVSDLVVDHTFNPFNLPRPYFNPQNQQQEPQQVFGKQVFDGQQVVIQNKDFVRMPIVQRNYKFNTFNKRTVTRSVIGGFQDNVNQKFERKGFSCFDMVGKVRQGTQPRLQRTFNMNKKGLMEPRMLTGQFPQMEQVKVMRAPQTPMGFTVMKRINTEPRNFNGNQVQSPGFVNRKQLTGDVKMKVNQPVTKTKLLKTRSVIDTLNQLSKINNMY